MKSDDKITYSKTLPIFTGALFAITVLFCLLKGTPETLGVIITTVSITGGAFVGTALMYMRKALRENIYKLDVASLKEKEKLDLHYIEKVLQLQKKYGATDDEIEQIRANTNLDEAYDEAYSDLRSNIKQGKSESEEIDKSEFNPMV